MVLLGNTSSEYDYDSRYRVTDETRTFGTTDYTTSYTYDSMDRITRLIYPGGETIKLAYNNQTLLESVEGVVEDLDYNARNQITRKEYTNDVVTTYTYDSMDRITGLTYPSGETIKLDYNNQTLLESVEGIVDDLDYNARNKITRKEYANGVVTTYTYDSQKLLLDRIYAPGLQDMSYEFDNIGNVLEIEDDGRNSVKTYVYDDLDRLTDADESVNNVSTYQRDFSYDRYGSIQEVQENSSTISTYGYGSTPFHAPSTYNGNSFDYDANGNLIEDKAFTYVYNDANQLREVRHAGNNSLVERYWYDEGGRRIQKENSNGEFTYYVNRFYEIDNGTATSYYFRDDERVAKQASGNTGWYLSDHLGSTPFKKAISKITINVS